MPSRIVPLLIVGAIVLIASLWLGQGIATNQMQTLLIAAAGAGFLLCLVLGQRVWLIAIFLMSMEIPLIRGFGTKETGQFLLVGFTVIIFMMHKFKGHWTFTEMDFWRIALAVMILQVYMRNPVGLNIFGASSVGARPYFVAIVALATGFVLSKYKIDPKEIKLAYWAILAGGILAIPLGRFRGGLGRQANPGSVQVVGEGLAFQGASRASQFSKPAEILALFITSKISPLKACFHPMWAVLILISLAFAALSGYRNVVAIIGIIYLFGIAYRGGVPQVIFSCAVGGIALALLAMINVAYPLPLNVQRALSPLPGKWDSRLVEGASLSTEWRVEMWKAALFTDEWIQNKWIGDGLGMTRQEMERMQALDNVGSHQSISGLTVQQESMMITGGYHSGPVETVRVIGYVGLIILYAGFIRLMIITHREILRSRGTEWYPYMLFLLIPVLMYPIFFTFIFGTFRDGVAFFFIQSGFVELIRKNLPLPQYIPNKNRHHIPLATRNLPEHARG